jgi:hypothetical protein
MRRRERLDHTTVRQNLATNETRLLDFQNYLEEDGHSDKIKAEESWQTSIVISCHFWAMQQHLNLFGGLWTRTWRMKSFVLDIRFHLLYRTKRTVKQSRRSIAFIEINGEHMVTHSRPVILVVDRWQLTAVIIANFDHAENHIRLLHQACASDHLLLSPYQRFFRSQ